MRLNAALFLAMSDSKKTLNRFRKIAFWEGISWVVLLFIAMPVKYGLGNEIGVKVVGPIHGGLFVAYVIFLILAAMEYHWPLKKSAIGFLASLIPFGPFIFDKQLVRESAEQTPADTASVD